MRKLKDFFARHKVASIVFALFLLIGVGPYLYSRAFAPLNRLTTHLINTDLQPSGSRDDRNHQNEPGVKIRIATYNIAHGRGAVDDNLKEGGEAKRKRVEQIANFLREL
ncbi:MAG: hypothetical protein AB8B55_11685, partial [Mariniblastus sp.]